MIELGFIGLFGLCLFLAWKLNSLPKEVNKDFLIELSRWQQSQGEMQNQRLKSELTFFSDSIRRELDRLSELVERKLDHIYERVNHKLGEAGDKSEKTFQGVLERLARIDEAQKKMEALSQDVGSLQDVLTDKKSRGIFGEVQLKNVLVNVFGEGQKFYSLQHKLSNGLIVDALLFLPEPLGSVAVDSKFPLENFQRMNSKDYTVQERDQFKKCFIRDVKKHMDDISSKYIISGETSEQAIMFLPAEALFAEIHAYFPELIAYAQKQKVWPASPTTFMATLTTVQSVILDIERNQYMHMLRDEIKLLSEDFARYRGRWDELSRHLNIVNRDVEKINTSTKKISGRFDKIMGNEFSEEKTLELIDQ